MTSLFRLGLAAASLAILMFSTSAYADGGHRSKKSRDGGCPGCGCGHDCCGDRDASDDDDEDDDDDERSEGRGMRNRRGGDEQFDLQSHIQEMMKQFRGGRGQGGNGLQDLEKLFQGGKNGRGGDILDQIRKMMEQRGGRRGARRGDEDDDARDDGDEDDDEARDDDEDEDEDEARGGDDDEDEDAENGEDEGNDWQNQARELFDSFRNGGRGGDNQGFEDMARRGMEEFQKLPPDARKQVEKLFSGDGGKGVQGMIEQFRKMMEQRGGRRGNHDGDEDEDQDEGIARI